MAPPNLKTIVIETFHLKQEMSASLKSQRIIRITRNHPLATTISVQNSIQYLLRYFNMDQNVGRTDRLTFPFHS